MVVVASNGVTTTPGMAELWLSKARAGLMAKSAAAIPPNTQALNLPECAIVPHPLSIDFNKIRGSSLANLR
ncbi:hypothetical protein CHELA1G11_12647 [Hyphomicrobiales bacterium]|nr:hypothetical protein CHELA1G2_11660 [Hyphomicrobiales bacterium]CAH1666146.1 hypothetical protein CHELA1G11_12647 [Hyphomicrobiales bacterium]